MEVSLTRCSLRDYAISASKEDRKTIHAPNLTGVSPVSAIKASNDRLSQASLAVTKPGWFVQICISGTSVAASLGRGVGCADVRLWPVPEELL